MCEEQRDCGCWFERLYALLLCWVDSNLGLRRHFSKILNSLPKNCLKFHLYIQNSSCKRVVEMRYTENIKTWKTRSILAYKYLDLIPTNKHSNASVEQQKFPLTVGIRVYVSQNFKALKLSYRFNLFRDAPAGLTFNNRRLCPHRVYVFCIYLRTNSDLCHLYHKLIGFYNRDEKCLLRGTNWVFK